METVDISDIVIVHIYTTLPPLPLPLPLPLPRPLPLPLLLSPSMYVTGRILVQAMEEHAEDVGVQAPISDKSFT